MRFTTLARALCLSLVLVALQACTDYKEPAQAALTTAEQAVDAIAADAQKYAPDKLDALKGDLAIAKSQFEKGDYRNALVAAKAVPGRAQELGTEVESAKKDAMDTLTTEWNALSEAVPQMVEAVNSRVTMLSKSKKLPKGMEQATFDNAKSGLDAMKASWDEATKAFTAGDVETAVTKAKETKQKGTEVMGLLGMSSAQPS